ncbi:hypothetical protein ES319_A13G146800v1 [Gossypium barbadense]|uniref:Uncharacterized protein n=2 Tax=Gossypium TaxID=3633 RepID=A0A5J5SZS1_GOSBA|nr:hypothetical protein ES319_A13G146800v1 [Gossypium barbadense]TYG86733.1 hypothetical protein ES288_A13G156700v1 [Gossypium darwinii]
MCDARQHIRARTGNNPRERGNLECFYRLKRGKKKGRRGREGDDAHGTDFGVHRRSTPPPLPPPRHQSETPQNTGTGCTEAWRGQSTKVLGCLSLFWALGHCVGPERIWPITNYNIISLL